MLRRLKKRRLALKDEISRLEAELDGRPVPRPKPEKPAKDAKAKKKREAAKK